MKLQRVSFPLDMAATAVNRIRPLVRHWGSHADYIDVKDLAFWCYTQGLLDGAQVAERVTAQPESVQ